MNVLVHGDTMTISVYGTAPDDLYLEHYGVLGMKWGQHRMRKAEQKSRYYRALSDKSLEASANKRMMSNTEKHNNNPISAKEYKKEAKAYEKEAGKYLKKSEKYDKKYSKIKMKIDEQEAKNNAKNEEKKKTQAKRALRYALVDAGFTSDPNYPSCFEKEASVGGKKIKINKFVNDSDVKDDPERIINKYKEIERDLPEIHKTAIDRIVKDYYDNSYMSNEWLTNNGKKISKKQFLDNLYPETVDEYGITYYSKDYTHYLSVEYAKDDSTGKYKSYRSRMDG